MGKITGRFQQTRDKEEIVKGNRKSVQRDMRNKMEACGGKWQLMCTRTFKSD